MRPHRLLMLLSAICLFLSASFSSDPAVRLMAQSAAQSPAEVAASFLDAWNNQDLEQMYGLLSQPSREIYSQTVFTNRYSVAHTAMNFAGVEYVIERTDMQGTSAAVHYSADLQSPVFGVITDPQRTMRLVQMDGNWRIAWSPMDIIDGLASEIQISVETRFPVRADIYDRNMNYIVEQGGTIVSISVIQQDMANVDNCLNLLANVMQRSRVQLAALFRNNNPETFFHVGEIDPEVYALRRAELDDICALADESAGFRKVSQYQGRRYVGHGAATHVTGYIGRVPGDQLALWQSRGYQASDLIGLAGVELAYEQVLAGRPERVLRMREPGGAIIRELGGATGESAIPVMLTIDMGLQNATSQAISDAYNYAASNWASVATGTGAVVMDVNTGEILALSSYPTFDPSLFNPSTSYFNPGNLIAALTTDPRGPLSNKAVQEQYTPGSIYKIFTSVTAAAENVFTAERIFNCELEWRGQQYGDTIAFRQDWRVIDGLDAAGEITMSQALTASCNPFFWEMGGLMFQRDRNMLAEYSERFGLGQRTNVRGLGPEAGGSVARPNNPSAAINNAIGQGDVQVTALQMVRAVSAIANRGTLYQPYIIKQVGGVDGVTLEQEFAPQVTRTMDLPDSVYDVVWQGMCAVTTNEDLGTAYSIFGNAPYSSCGKTGTAETGARGSGRPPHAWYVSFAPAENPQIAVVVFTANSREGSEVSAPITRRILDYYFGFEPAPFPGWWEGPYVPLEAPAGVAG